MRSVSLAFVAIVLAVPAHGASRYRLALHPAGERILWVAAHPDDELLAAPFLALRCRQQGALCAFAVATRGERGLCALPSCGPDLATVRASELDIAASFLGAWVIRGSLPDGSGGSPGEVLEAWDGVESFLRTAIEVVQPDFIVTFDPRHGSTCHPDHRAIARALLDLGPGVPVGVLTATATVAGEWDEVGFEPNLAEATIAIDANATIGRLGATGWDVLVRVARIHGSQFPEKAVEALERVMPERRAVGVRWLAPGERLEGDRCLD